ncbi:ferredoxin reductase family protein [Lunatibacter salilacus]|uniref:ferredoxin reductase family protein n=1 Tax=Lunatibacter salilacus TaxID=2483804 RepID=UPI00131E631A|nr:ferric reductase-like transmembrane domain-containing protein [Lunatibacter salilacus]
MYQKSRIKPYSTTNGLLWLGIFVVIALLPLAIAYSGPLPPVRTFLEEFGVSLGFIGLSLFALQFLFSGRVKGIAPSFGVDNIVQFHKEIGVIAILFSLAHPISMLLADWGYVSFFDPEVNLPRAISLVAVTIGMVLLLVTSLWRLSFGLSYEVWRLIHGVLGFLIIFVGVVHSVQVGHYLDGLEKVVPFVVLFASLTYLLAHTRLVRPYRNKRKPYIVREVVPQRDDCYTLILDPKGHDGMAFEPGQFIWITIKSSPFSLQQHPFSYSGSAAKSSISITAKQLGDFTEKWETLKSGQQAFVEGPFGSFTLKNRPCFFVMGGIGVTPAISILTTLKDLSDKRECVLLYGNEDWKKIPFREQLDQLQKEINLTTVHILEKPHDDWDGEEGLINEDVIQRFLPKNKEQFDYFICGPAPMMDVAELALRKAGVPWNQIYAERFDLA